MEIAATLAVKLCVFAGSVVATGNGHKMRNNGIGGSQIERYFELATDLEIRMVFGRPMIKIIRPYGGWHGVRRSVQQQIHLRAAKIMTRSPEIALALYNPGY